MTDEQWLAYLDSLDHDAIVVAIDRLVEAILHPPAHSDPVQRNRDAVRRHRERNPSGFRAAQRAKYRVRRDEINARRREQYRRRAAASKLKVFSTAVDGQHIGELEMTKVQELKIELYELVERQSILAAENQRVEKLKNEKLQELSEAREAEAKETK